MCVKKTCCSPRPKMGRAKANRKKQEIANNSEVDQNEPLLVTRGKHPQKSVCSPPQRVQKDPVLTAWKPEGSQASIQTLLRELRNHPVRTWENGVGELIVLSQRVGTAGHGSPVSNRGCWSNANHGRKASMWLFSAGRSGEPERENVSFPHQCQAHMSAPTEPGCFWYKKLKKTPRSS